MKKSEQEICKETGKNGPNGMVYLAYAIRSNLYRLRG